MAYPDRTLLSDVDLDPGRHDRRCVRYVQIVAKQKAKTVLARLQGKRCLGLTAPKVDNLF